jgi:hypothetical protein
MSGLSEGYLLIIINENINIDTFNGLLNGTLSTVFRLLKRIFLGV